MPTRRRKLINLLDFKLVDQFPGYNSASDKTKLDPGYLIRGSKNVYKKKSGTIASRPGLKRRGEADDTNAGVVASFEWETNVGTKRYLRVTSDNKLQVESDIEEDGTPLWYDLLTTSTLTNPAASLTRFVFDTWWDNSEQTDRLIMVRGDNNVLHWSGAMALILSTTATTITKQGSESWAEIGLATQIAGEKKIIINGKEVTYTGGESTTTLTGCTISSGAVTDLTSGMVAIQSVMEATPPDVDSTYKYDFCKSVNNQTWFGSYSSRLIYISADVTSGGVLGFLNLVDSNSHVYGDPDFLTLDNQAKGIGVKSGKVIIFAGNSDMYIVTPNQNVTFSYTGTDGNTRYNFQKIEKKELNGLSAAISHEMIGNFGDLLVWVDQDNQLRALGAFTNIDEIVPTTLSLDVEDELRGDDFTGGQLRVIVDTIYITAPNTGRDWMYQSREKLDEAGAIVRENLWHPPQVRSISRFAVIEGEIYGHSNANPQIYQVWNTNQWFDDSPSDEPIPYTCVARFAYRTYENRYTLKTYSIILIEGYMPQGTNLYGKVYCDYQGSSGVKLFTVNAPIEDADDLATFFYGGGAVSLGDSSFGDNPLGDGIIEESDEQELIPKFRAAPSISQSNFFEDSIELYSTEADSRWEILCIGPNQKTASQHPTFIRK